MSLFKIFLFMNKESISSEKKNIIYNGLISNKSIDLITNFDEIDKCDYIFIG